VLKDTFGDGGAEATNRRFRVLRAQVAKTDAGQDLVGVALCISGNGREEYAQVPLDRLQ